MFKDIFLQLLFSLNFLFTVEEYPLPIQMDVENVLFDNGYVYFVENRWIRGYDLDGRRFLLPMRKPIHSSVGMSNGNFLICEWKNFVISDPSEYSTEIRIYGKGKEDITEIELHPTVKPINCSTKFLYLETSYPLLEKKYFRYSFEKDVLEEISNTKDLERESIWRNMFGNVWVYVGKDNLVWISRKVLKL